MTPRDPCWVVLEEKNLTDRGVLLQAVELCLDPAEDTLDPAQRPWVMGLRVVEDRLDGKGADMVKGKNALMAEPRGKSKAQLLDFVAAESVGAVPVRPQRFRPASSGGERHSPWGSRRLARDFRSGTYRPS